MFKNVQLNYSKNKKQTFAISLEHKNSFGSVKMLANAMFVKKFIST